MSSHLPADPFEAFSVGRTPGSALAEMVQKLGPGLTDHRGLIDLPALTVLFDDIGGVAFYTAAPESSMQARLSMSMLDRPETDEVLEATARLRMTSPGYGLTAVDIAGRDGRLLCTGSARNVRVGRSVENEAEHFDLAEPVPADRLPAVAAPDPALPGRTVIEAIAAGELPAGRIAELLGMRLQIVDDAPEVHCATAPWEGNVMGTMHGGVIAAAVAQGISFGAQWHTRPGAGYQLVDFTIDFLRSPAVDGREVTVRITPIKLGRRLSLFAADLYDGSLLLAHATAGARFDV